uniref:Uncharacterized protein n=1 Tax=Anguilla anguilla TaxID=7936 RepID=A0A0E9W215_ANGAN
MTIYLHNNGVTEKKRKKKRKLASNFLKHYQAGLIFFLGPWKNPVTWQFDKCTSAL